MRTYASPAAFHAALEARVRAEADRQGRPLNRVRTLLVMERFLARVVAVFPESAMLKGGLALELRLEKARTTKDIDLRMVGSPDHAALLMQSAAQRIPEPDDFLRFTVTPDPDHPTIEGDGLVYDGFRFNAAATIAARPYGDPFGVDLAYADVVHGAPIVLSGSSLFAFIGVDPVRVRAYPASTHLAEKLHAYTLPRSRPNTRVKDLADMALIGTLAGHVADDLASAIQETFSFRGSHPVPSSLPEPPVDWESRYRRLAQEEALAWVDLPQVLDATRAFVDPILGGRLGTWDPGAWAWR